LILGLIAKTSEKIEAFSLVISITPNKSGENWKNITSILAHAQNK
jgi:hypothetical protein